MLSKFFKDSVVYAVSGILTRGLSFILLPLYTRLISPGEYGAFDLLIAFGTLVNLTVALEIAQALIRFYNDNTSFEEKRGYAGTALVFTAVMYTIFLAVALIFAPRLSVLVMGASGFEAVFRVGLGYLWLNGLFNLLQNIFRSDLQSRRYALSSILMAVVTAVASVFLAYVMKLGLMGIVGGMALGALTGCVYAFIHLRDVIRPVCNVDLLKKMLKFSTPLVPSSIAVFIAYYIDRLMIRHFLSLEDVGIYGIAFRIANITSIIMMGFQVALVPLIYTHHRDRETPAHLATIFRFFMGLALLMFLGLGVFSKEILWLMTTPDYYRAAPIVLFLTPAILLSNMYIFAPGASIENKTHMILWINVAGAALNIALNFVLIPLLGIVGACLATMLNYACVFALYMVTSHRLYPIPYEWGLYARAAAAVVALTVIGFACDFGLWADIVIKALLVVVALLVFLLLGLVRREEVVAAYRKVIAYKP